MFYRILMAVCQNQWYHFGVGAPPILDSFSGGWDVHWGYGLLTHGQMTEGAEGLVEETPRLGQLAFPSCVGPTCAVLVFALWAVKRSPTWDAMGNGGNLSSPSLVWTSTWRKVCNFHIAFDKFEASASKPPWPESVLWSLALSCWADSPRDLTVFPLVAGSKPCLLAWGGGG